MSAEDDMPRRRAEFGRKMRVRRITGGIQIATGIVAVILLFVVVGVIGSGRAGVIILMGLSGALLWFAADGPADRLAERIEAWLSGPMR